ncbi:CU044_2847 family protein [Streptomyces sp. NBC_00847]|uniref:CU044_2847 family protein n=1 Tax=Streptomyces sp. NBC_00847 TaxID=2975850 RepID=UPI00224CBA5F|nr:CU044_2847 family protein [Streptomyces sp. NBC_00847]MCX4884749.1 CU044_2847 family protein [Streptomyces sp. NBC_00847]
MGQQLARVPLEGGGSILVEATEDVAGPVKAGRLGDAIRDLPVGLSDALEPVTELARTVLGRLRDAGPTELEVEFGINLATEAGVVITKTSATCHLTVKMLWRKDDPDAEPVPSMGPEGSA